MFATHTQVPTANPSPFKGKPREIDRETKRQAKVFEPAPSPIPKGNPNLLAVL